MDRPFPVPDATAPFWRSELHELDSFRASDTVPSEQDVVIVGSGFSGAALAFHLSGHLGRLGRDVDEDDDARTPGAAAASSAPAPYPLPSITILEAREACSGATARNGGHVRPDLYGSVPGRAAKYGLEAASEIADFELANFHAVWDLVRDFNVDCDFQLTTSLSVFRDSALAAGCKQNFDELIKLGSPTARLVQCTQGPAAETVSNVKGACATFASQGGSIWPYKLVMFMLSKSVERGAKLYTHTPALEISEERVNGFWEVRTTRGTIRAKKIIFATNGYTAALLPQFKDRIVPVRGVCSRISVPAGQVAPHLPFSYALRHGDNLYDYQITRPDGSIVAGGARTEIFHQRQEWYNVCDDSKVPSAAVPYFEGYMQRFYRGWEDSGASVDRIWTGIMGYTSDLLPHVGAVPSKEGQYVCAGFNGHGMAFILLCARGLARMVSDGIPFSQSGIPRLFETTEERIASSRNEVLE